MSASAKHPFDPCLSTQITMRADADFWFAPAFQAPALAGLALASAASRPAPFHPSCRCRPHPLSLSWLLALSHFLVARAAGPATGQEQPRQCTRVSVLIIVHYTDQDRCPPPRNSNHSPAYKQPNLEALQRSSVITITLLHPTHSPRPFRIHKHAYRRRFGHSTAARQNVSCSFKSHCSSRAVSLLSRRRKQTGERVDRAGQFRLRVQPCCLRAGLTGRGLISGVALSWQAFPGVCMHVNAIDGREVSKL